MSMCAVLRRSTAIIVTTSRPDMRCLVTRVCDHAPRVKPLKEEALRLSREHDHHRSGSRVGSRHSTALDMSESLTALSLMR